MRRRRRAVWRAACQRERQVLRRVERRAVARVRRQVAQWVLRAQWVVQPVVRQVLRGAPLARRLTRTTTIVAGRMQCG